MAFDLYVGSLHRYRMGDWLNVGQQIAEEEGFTYVMHGRSARVDGTLNRLVAERSYKSWVKRAEAGLKRAGLGPWNDDPSQDYVTDRPGWEGFVGMCLKFAYLLNPSKPEASQVPSFVVAQEDEAFMLAAEHSYPFRCLAYARCGFPAISKARLSLRCRTAIGHSPPRSIGSAT